MAGFPRRFFRSFLGPTLVDRRPVENKKHEVPAAALNALFAQICGLNLVVPRVSLAARWDGSTFRIEHQAEAWNPDGNLARPTLARASTGVYSYTFAASYPDEEGATVSTELRAPRVTCQKVLSAFSGRIEPHAWLDADNPLIVHIRLWDASGTLVDEPFWLEVL